LCSGGGKLGKGKKTNSPGREIGARGEWLKPKADAGRTDPFLGKGIFRSGRSRMGKPVKGPKGST